MGTAKDKFTYRLSNWYTRPELKSVEDTLKADNAWEHADYVYKRREDGLSAIFTKGELAVDVTKHEGDYGAIAFRNMPTRLR